MVKTKVMGYFIILIFTVIFITVIIEGCAVISTEQPEVINNCTIYEDLGIDTKATVIPQYINDPCTFQNLLITAVNTSILLDLVERQDVIEALNKIKTYAIVGATIDSFRVNMTTQVQFINDSAGTTIYKVNSVINNVPGYRIITYGDVKLIEASIDNLLEMM